jgi:hypothetical protein
MKAIGATSVPFAASSQESAGDMEDCLVIQVFPVDPQVAQKGDPLGVTQEKRCFVICG